MSIGLSTITIPPKTTPAQAQDLAGDVGSARAPNVAGPRVVAPRVADVVASAERAAQVRSSPTTTALEALDSATGTIDAASASGRAIVASLGEIRRAVVVATDASVTAPQRAVLGHGVQAHVADIQRAVAGAGFSGVNLLDGSASAIARTAVASDGSKPITLQGADLTPGSGIITVTADADLSTPESARAVLTQVDSSTAAARTVVGLVDAQGRSLAAQAEALTNASSPRAAGETSSADAAGLLALQIRQQIGAASGSLVGPASQSILSLFRDHAA